MKVNSTMARFRLYGVFVLLLLTCSISFCQTDPSFQPENVKIASPNAASLGKVVDIPVSYNTGIPNIDIPIYTVHEGPLQLPISLSYHASGLKVMEQSSWVGAGWALNAGGVITRTIRGTPDDRAFADTYYLQDKGYYSYLYAPGTTPTAPILDYVAITGGLKDSEPDLFFFNFNGYSGKFYFRADKTPVVVPQQDIRIRPLFCADNPNNCTAINEPLRGFVITTPDGVNYYFGIDDNNPSANPPVERVLPYSFTTGLAFSDLQIVSSWYLYKIESPDKKFKIDLSYAKEEYSTYSLALYPKLNTNGEIGMSKCYMYGQRLSTIMFTNGTVTFNADGSPRQDLSGATTANANYDYDNTTDAYPAKGLASIQISSPTFCRIFELTKSYFVDNHSLVGTYGATVGGAGVESVYNLHTDKKRLKLDKLTEKSCIDNAPLVKPPHIFTYYDEANVPRTLSLAQDHWGFYNGATANTTLIPDTSTDGGWIFSSGGADREASFPNMRAGALQKVTYPTGGTSEFSYGAHRVFVNKNYYTTSASWAVNAVGSGSYYHSVTYTITVNSLTMFKYRAKNVNGGGGTVYFGSTYGDTGWNYQLIKMQPGTYQFYCVSSGGASDQGIMAELSQLDQSTNLETVLVGGLRIETLTTNDGSGANNIVQTFDYTNNNGQDQGVLFSRPSYIGIVRNDRMLQSGFATSASNQYVVAASPTNGCNPTQAISDQYGNPITLSPDYYISPSSLHPMRTLQGSHFGYNQVKVTQGDGGYTIYQYKLEPNVVQDVCVRAIDKNYCDPLAPNFPGAPDPFDPSRGELRGVYVFNAGNTMLKSTQYQMDYLPEPVGVNGLIVKATGPFFFATEYELKTYKKTKSTTLEFTYNTANPAQTPVGIITEVLYGSNYHSQESKRIISEVSQGDMISNVVKGKVLSERRSSYVADLATSTCDPDYSWNTTYASQYASFLQDYNTTISGTCDALCKFLAWQRFTYNTNEVRKTYVTNKTSYENGKNNCLTGKANAAGPELKALFDLKIRNQLDPVIESSQWRDGNFLQSSYITVQDVSANRLDIYPSKYESIQTSTPLASSAFSPGYNNGTIIIKDGKYVQEEAYSYSNGNLVEVTAKNGIVTSYIWGYNNNFPIVKAIGVPYSTLSAAYNAVSGNLLTLRSQASLAKAQVSTYEYDPLIGMTSQTDANGVKTTFGYDKLGRLQFAKDQYGNLLKTYNYHYKIN